MERIFEYLMCCLSLNFLGSLFSIEFLTSVFVFVIQFVITFIIRLVFNYLNKKYGQRKT
jgi:uncharacterized membrane protein YjjP (DUF1212 family)